MCVQPGPSSGFRCTDAPRRGETRKGKSSNPPPTSPTSTLGPGPASNPPEHGFQTPKSSASRPYKSSRRKWPKHPKTHIKLSCEKHTCRSLFSTKQVGYYHVWSLTQFYPVDFSQSRIGVKKCVFNKRTIKVRVSCC